MITDSERSIPRQAEHIDSIAHIHRVLLKLLLDFDELCRANDIRYFLGGGTLLGAIRHEGFIPWDDDVDVMMLREDYDRFCALGRDKLPPHLFIQTYKTDPHYHGDMAKLRLNGTVYSTEFAEKTPLMHQGFFIDVFAHDRTAKKPAAQKRHIFLTRFIRSVVFHKWEGTPMQFYGSHKLACALFSGIKNLLPMTFWERRREALFKRYQSSSSPWLYDGMGQHLTHGVFPRTWLDTVEYRRFEGHMLPVPGEYDKYLRFSYGNYMEIPEECDRVFHKIKKIDFGAY